MSKWEYKLKSQQNVSNFQHVGLRFRKTKKKRFQKQKSFQNLTFCSKTESSFSEQKDKSNKGKIQNCRLLDKHFESEI